MNQVAFSQNNRTEVASFVACVSSTCPSPQSPTLFLFSKILLLIRVSFEVVCGSCSVFLSRVY